MAVALAALILYTLGWLSPKLGVARAAIANPQASPARWHFILIIAHIPSSFAHMRGSAPQ
jgi:hypothetical protein